MFELAGVAGCLWASTGFATAAGGISLLLRRGHGEGLIAEMKVEASD